MCLIGLIGCSRLLEKLEFASKSREGALLASVTEPEVFSSPTRKGPADEWDRKLGDRHQSKLGLQRGHGLQRGQAT